MLRFSKQFLIWLLGFNLFAQFNLTSPSQAQDEVVVEIETDEQPPPTYRRHYHGKHNHRNRNRNYNNDDRSRARYRRVQYENGQAQAVQNSNSGEEIVEEVYPDSGLERKRRLSYQREERLAQIQRNNQANPNQIQTPEGLKERAQALRERNLARKELLQDLRAELQGIPRDEMNGEAAKKIRSEMRKVASQARLDQKELHNIRQKLESSGGIKTKDTTGY